MGIGDTKIDKSALGALARNTIQKGNFGKFAKDISKDFSNIGLEQLRTNINSARNEKSNNEPTL